MKHKVFILSSFLMTFMLIFSGCCGSKSKEGSCCASQDAQSCAKKQIYEWRIYTLSGDDTALDDYFQKALIPAYNRNNISVGAFKLFNAEDKDQRYLLFVYPCLMTYNKVRQAVWNDAEYQRIARSFFDASAPNPAYSLFETYICEAFDKMPQMRIPDKSRTLFEYRNYGSRNEDANKRKIKMFNTEEIDLFDKVGINSVCYGEVLSGTRMPSLTYLTWYKDDDAYKAAWDAFRVHPDWNQMRVRPEYSNTATNNQGTKLSPMPYSQF